MGVGLKTIGLVGPALAGSAAVALLAIADAGPARAAALTVEAGDVKAEYSDTEGDVCVESPSLTITRGEAIAFDEAIASELGICQQDQFELRDLDQDGEPEILIDFYSGGAHCCWFTQVYRYDADQGQYRANEQSWGNGGSAILEDLEGDGQPEFVSRDDRFAYQFSSFADSAFPPQIWRYGDGTFIDVTRQYPDQVYDEAYGLWQLYGQARVSGRETKGVLAAYLATKHLLGQAEDGWQRVQAAYQGGDRPQFFADLSTFLQQTGYTAAFPASEFSGTPALPATDDSGTSLLLEQQGSLDPGDGILPTDGSLYDEHLFTAEAGDVVLIRLESDTFDPYLFLVGPQGELIAQNDDASESDISAVLEVRLPQSGAYRAIANSYNSTGRGGYQLTVRRRQIGTSSEESAVEAELEGRDEAGEEELGDR